MGTLDLDVLHRDFPLMSSLIIKRVIYNPCDIPKGDDNVLCAEWLSLFPSLQTVDIFTEGREGSDFKFRLDNFLDSIQFVPSSITFVIHGGGWVQSKFSKDIVAAFKAAGWNIELVTTE